MVFSIYGFSLEIIKIFLQHDKFFIPFVVNLRVKKSFGCEGITKSIFFINSIFKIYVVKES